MTVFLTTTNPTGDAVELDDDRTFLIKGPVEDGKTTYFLTRALERYAVPDTIAPNSIQTVEEYFNKQLVSTVYLTVEVQVPAERVNFSSTALSKKP